MRSKQTPEELKQKHYENYRFWYPVPKKVKKFIKQKIRDRKYQEDIIKNWKLYGMFIEPTEKQIEEEIELEELMESDDIEYIELDDIIENIDEDE